VVNQYLAEVSGGNFSAKDFRTWTGTVAAAVALCEADPAGSKAQTTRRIKRARRQVAERRGDSPAICRKCYVHPDIIRAYIDGTLATDFSRNPRSTASRTGIRLRPEERAVITLLKKRKRMRTGAAAVKGINRPRTVL
jgi:DNA topoisomerase-1